MKTNLSYDIALALARTVVIDLAPACERIEIAGSLRRCKPEVGDIELVCIPVCEIATDMFGQPLIVSSALDSRLDTIAKLRGWKRIKGGHLYQSYNLGPCCLDLFITTPEKWGVIYTLRTGSADFSRWLVTARREGGACPGYLRVLAGRIWAGGITLATPEEPDIFRALELEWIPPEERECIPARPKRLPAIVLGGQP